MRTSFYQGADIRISAYRNTIYNGSTYMLATLTIAWPDACVTVKLQANAPEDPPADRDARIALPCGRFYSAYVVTERSIGLDIGSRERTYLASERLVRDCRRAKICRFGGPESCYLGDLLAFLERRGASLKVAEYARNEQERYHHVWQREGASV